MRPIRDATGEIDYGNIDAWWLDGAVSHVVGEWGELEIDGGVVRLELEPEDAVPSRVDGDDESG
jgi:hypothetical protein